MGQKINPIGFRVGVIRDWDAKWYADKKEYVPALQEDLRIRKYLETNLKDAAVDRITIERTEPTRINLTIHTAKPGIVIGRGGADVERLRSELSKIVDTYKGQHKRVNINIVEIRKPDLNAHLVGQQIAADLERRVAFRRAMRGAIQRVQRAGAKGVRTMVSGRLNGADIARKEQYTEGTVPLHTLRADIDYSWDEAMTSYGNLGIKTWIYRGDAENGQFIKDEDVAAAANNRGRGNSRQNGGRSRRPRQGQASTQGRGGNN
ncbi:30S ribosomal protein S3 [Oenococcus oeni IOEB_9304]|uniref:30S ribosomal protein S3 n=1 Tax=Oenococcus oeni TaxID=1247 RepID=UPI00050E9349|nr:30S ribosomal protein S3 [Oenococcus oeni]KGH60412.1 30S ribosomal protein S3 [Oenococcus oeni IOEB_9805]KGH65493.1 30S ribosomal protein S3 [Oenococcus oeni IOEB_C23]KGH75365.1 30S ribosomal protein S3 [Oenococcus oeni IOEB_9803]KGH77019.1 30S ribosomal protein S3 [Oenococcus oeni IOEB_9304]KGH79294.1 30S ribosomal protein S3 [Oenococcus oeni IOEB_8417]